MKWGQASRRQKKPWDSGDESSPAGAAAPATDGSSKPWHNDQQKPSVAKILNAISFEDDNDNDRNNWESLDKSQASLAMTEDPTETESTLEHTENGDDKAPGETGKQEDDDKEEEEVLTLPEETSKVEEEVSAENQQPLSSPSGSVYYNAKETEEDEPTPSKETEMPLLELQDSTETAPGDQDESEHNILTPPSPVQSGVRYFSEELRLKQQLSNISSKSNLYLDAAILPEGAVKQKVETVELTEAQIACKRLAHAAAAAAQRRIAERERQAGLQLPLKREPTSPSATATIDNDTPSPSSRADQLQSELEKGRQRALEALARAKQQKEQQQEQQQQQQQADEICVRSTVLVSGEIPKSKSEDEHDNEDEHDDDWNDISPHEMISNDQSSVHSECSTESFGNTTNSKTRISEIIRSELWHKDDAVVQAALQHLAEQAGADSNCSTVIAKQGGILAVVRAMEQHIDSARIQIAACNALETLALDTEHELVIGQVGGVEAIVSAMMAHLSHPSVQEAAWSALWNCTCGNACDIMTGMDTQGGLSALVSCMQEHLGNADVQANACGALTNLCVAHEGRLEALVQAGGVVAVATALQRHWRNERVRREASLCMTLLLEGQATNVDDEGSCSVIDEVVVLEEEEMVEVEEEEEVVDHEEEAYDEEVLDEDDDDEEEEETLVEDDDELIEADATED